MTTYEKLKHNLDHPVIDASENELLRDNPEFDALVREKRELDLRTARDEARLKIVNEELKIYLEVAGVERVGVLDGAVLQLANGGTASRIDKVKLVEKGVGVDVIEACTIPSNKYKYVQITAPKTK